MEKKVTNGVNTNNATRMLDTTTLRIEHWVKTLLVQWFVKDGDWACEVFPGVGSDLGKWQRANVGQYTVIEPNKQNLKQLYKACLTKSFKNFPLIIQTELSEKLLPFDKHPSHLPIITSFRSKSQEGETQLNISPKALNEPHCNKYQVVSCFQGFEGVFQSEIQVKYFLANVSQLLKVGGYFVGIMTDSSSLFTKAHKKSNASKVITSEDKGFELHMPFDSAVESFQELISTLPFILKIREDSKELKSNLYLVHCPTFIKLCREVGLDLIEIQNIQDFYEENRKLHEITLKKILNGIKPKPIHLSRLSLFSSFVFQKIADVNFADSPLNQTNTAENNNNNNIDISDSNDKIEQGNRKELNDSLEILPNLSNEKSVILDQSNDNITNQIEITEESMEDDQDINEEIEKDNANLTEKDENITNDVDNSVEMEMEMDMEDD